MGYFEYLKNSFRILFCKEESLFNIVADKNSLLFGFITLFIAGIATSIYSLNINTILLNILSLLLFVFVGFLFFHLLALGFLKGEARTMDYARALLAPLIIYWIAVIPVIGIIVQIIGTLWLIIVNIFFLRKLHKLSTTKAVILGILPLILLFVYLIVIGDKIV